MTDWPLYKLDELGSVNRGRSRHRPRNAPHLYGGQYPFIQTADVKESNLYITEYTQTYNDAGLAQSKLWKPGTLCITIAANIAETGILGIPACFPDSIIGFIPYEGKSDVRYIKYYFDIFQKTFQQISQGATQDNLSAEKLVSLKIPAPPLPMQKKIADILSAYDDLIENNLKRIKLLEEMAQITYEEWFVRLRFPGHESTPINSETGLPEGWQEVGLSELITKLESGSRPKGGIDKNLNEGVPSVGAENVIGLGRYNYSSEKLVPEEFYSKMKRGKICQKDILVYKDGAYIGKTSMFQDNFPHQTCAVNEHVFLINSAEEFFQNYLFLTLSREDYYLKMQGLNSNAAQPGLNQEKLKSLSLIKPLDKNIEDFNSHIEPMVKSIFALAKQNRLLQNARDVLLPRLMTGVIDVESYDPAQLLKEAA